MQEHQTNERCWAKDGLWGDCTCSNLKSVLHCRNCKTFENIASKHLSKATLPTLPNVEPIETVITEEYQAYFVFKCSNELFAIHPHFVGEVTTSVPVHRIPHRIGNTIEGISNINGELVLVVDLYNTFSLEKSEDYSGLMVLCNFANEKLAFKTNSVLGVRKVDKSKIEEFSYKNTPFVSQKFSTSKLSNINVIDIELLTSAIVNRRI